MDKKIFLKKLKKSSAGYQMSGSPGASGTSALAKNKVDTLKQVTRGFMHPSQNKTGILPGGGANKPADRKHVRADTMTHQNFVLEKNEDPGEGDPRDPKGKRPVDAVFRYLHGTDSLEFKQHVNKEKQKPAQAIPKPTDKMAKARGVPKGVDKEKHERCVKEVKKQGKHYNPYAVCSASLKKTIDVMRKAKGWTPILSD